MFRYIWWLAAALGIIALAVALLVLAYHLAAAPMRVRRAGSPYADYAYGGGIRRRCSSWMSAIGSANTWKQ